jgi:enoyl-CoA hydratase/carnithine racemase
VRASKRDGRDAAAPGGRSWDYSRAVTMDTAAGSTRSLTIDWNDGDDVVTVAKEFLLLGERMTAQRAEQFGMVNRIVPRDKLREETAAVAAKLAAQPRLGAWLTKQAVNHVEELRGKRTAMEAVFHMHHFAHAQNDLTSDNSLGGLDAKSMASANKKQAGE